MSTLLVMDTQTRFELIYESYVGSIYRYFTRRSAISDCEVLRLTAWDGLAPDQLALVLNISVSGAGAALSRARRKFEEEMVK